MYILYIYKTFFLNILKMCFTPTISLTTAIIEFIVVIYLIKRIKDKSLRALPWIILILGLYQLTEFFLCTTDNQIWPKLGFIMYTFLPILLMQLFLVEILYQQFQDYIIQQILQLYLKVIFLIQKRMLVEIHF